MRIAVLLSGGVDSSVALRLLQEQGHQLVAFYLKIWLEDELSFLGTCPWEEDLGYVRAVCEREKIPLEIVSLQEEYRQEIITYVVEELKVGRTPNPDILCNQRIKFGAFYSLFGAHFDKVATGHYAQVINREGLFHLYCSVDRLKDQTYFLSSLNQKQMEKALFPLASLDKQMVRSLAQKFDLPNSNRKDSQGLCFLGAIKFHEFIRHHLGTRVGDLVDCETGLKVGTHQGFWYYTIGQRQGIGLSGGPWYVVDKNISDNTVFVSRSYYADDKLRKDFIVERCNWISEAPRLPSILQVKMRHGEYFHEAAVYDNGDGKLSVHLKNRDQGIASGQYAVFYQGMHCLGSGIINASNKRLFCYTG
jgi:tRNA-5-taurinomethyluridine 2-sulfurtransferase